jgi:formate hydrogenlyase subunit 3/multisubunit Na+/H+ antiporter MnhD subunit
MFFIEVGNLAACGIVVLLNDDRAVIKAGMKYLLMEQPGFGPGSFGYRLFLHHDGPTSTSPGCTGAGTEPTKTSPAPRPFDGGPFYVGFMGQGGGLSPAHLAADAHSGAPTHPAPCFPRWCSRPYMFLLMKVLFRVFGPAVTDKTPVFRHIVCRGRRGHDCRVLWQALRQKKL